MVNEIGAHTTQPTQLSGVGKLAIEQVTSVKSLFAHLFTDMMTITKKLQKENTFNKHKQTLKRLLLQPSHP